MINKILQTDRNGFMLLTLRLTLGLVIFAHGAQKLFGIWGGHGVAWTIKAWEEWFNIPSFLTITVIIIESIGALLLIFGLATRIWAALIGAIMLVAVYLVHLQWGFYMNWYMQPQTGEGFEYHILVLGIVIAIIIGGGGKWSLDTILLNKINSKN